MISSYTFFFSYIVFFLFLSGLDALVAFRFSFPRLLSFRLSLLFSFLYVLVYLVFLFSYFVSFSLFIFYSFSLFFSFLFLFLVLCFVLSFLLCPLPGSYSLLFSFYSILSVFLFLIFGFDLNNVYLSLSPQLLEFILFLISHSPFTSFFQPFSFRTMLLSFFFRPVFSFILSSSLPLSEELS